MKIVVPFLYNSFDISIDSHKLLLTMLKSYIFNDNTTPIVIAITHKTTKELLDKFIETEQCSNIISYIEVNKTEVFKNTKEFAHYGHMFGNIIKSKFYCVKNICIDDDIIISDSDMLYVSKIDWGQHIIPNSKVQWFENYYKSSYYSSNLGKFLENVAEEKNITVKEIISNLPTNYRQLDLNMGWPNGGLIYYSKEYRQNEFSNDFIEFKKSEWFKIHLYEEEPFYLYLFYNKCHVNIKQNSILNKRIYTWADENIVDPSNITNCALIHYCIPGDKPTEYTFTGKDGYIIREKQESIYHCTHSNLLWNYFFQQSATTRMLLILWHYYYSKIAYYLFDPLYEFKSDEFEKIIKNYTTDYYKITKNI